MKSILLGALFLFSLGYSGTRMNMGSAGDYFTELKNRNLKPGSRFSFVSSRGENFTVPIRDFYMKNNRLSVTGQSSQGDISEFIFKGTPGNLYGWIVLESRHIAYEYTTDINGRLVVEEVPMEKIKPVCSISGRHSTSNVLPKLAANPLQAAGPERHIGSYDNRDIRTLQSRPGSKKVIYLDITRTLNGATPLFLTKEGVWQTWQTVSSLLSAFDVNVTTDKSVYDSTEVVNSGIARFTNTSTGSFASLNSFGTTDYCTLEPESDGYAQGRIAGHEISHQFGLDHDGGVPGENGGTEYFLGLSEFHWTPLMGSVWVGDRWGDNALYQYSKGEYNTATQKQDDLKLINRYFDYLPDDKPRPVPLVISENGGVVSALQNRGFIGANSDSDAFQFEIKAGGGKAQLHIDRTEYLGGAMLDVQAELHDNSGNLIAKSNPKASRFADLVNDLVPGRYTLLIKGGAEGTPQTGFSNYSSMGYYAIEGTVANSTVSVVNLPQKARAKITISPSGSMHIEGMDPTTRILNSKVYSVSGKLIFSQGIGGVNYNLGDIPAGVYHVLIHTTGGIVHQDFVK